MRRFLPLRNLVPLLAVLAMVSCVVRMSNNAVNGSGVSRTESRNLATFDRVRLDGAADVTVTIGGQTSVTVTGDDNILPLVETTVSDGRLIVGSRESYRAKTPVKVAVTVPSLAGLELNGSGRGTVDGTLTGKQFKAAIHGSGDLRIEQVKLERLDVSIAGSGDVSAAGTADAVQVSISGSGDVRLADVAARSAVVDVGGSGGATVQASDTLRVRISGSGDVRYRGRPTIESSVAGSGQVAPAD
jgi:hypothetical protein